jgi:hypothetical protein
MVIGDKICSFPNCTRTAVAHIKIVHRYQMGDLESWESVCQPHLECVQCHDDEKAQEMLKAIFTHDNLVDCS